MIEKTTENQFSTVVYGELGDLFRSQNWRIREQKEGRSSRKLLTKEEVWKTALGLASEDQLDQLLAEVAIPTPTHGQITFLLAKCMFYDGSTWKEAIKNFWFSPDSLEPFKKQSLAELKVLKKHDEDRVALQLLGEHLPVEIKDYDDAAEIIFPYPAIAEDGSEGMMPCSIQVPRKLINIAGLLEKKAYQRKSDKNYRNTVTYRMRTDCNEIIKLAAVACDMSATEFVEALALETSQLMVRSKLKQFEIGAEPFKPSGSGVDDLGDLGFEDAINEFFGKQLYMVLCSRYSAGETNGFFPAQRYVSPKKGVHHTNGGKWIPEDEAEKDLKFDDDTTRETALKWIYHMIQDTQKRVKMWTERENAAKDMLGVILEAPDDADFAKICNDHWDSTVQPIRKQAKAGIDEKEPAS
jgi:hypothetical protein